jgi:hypothetical protein
MQHELWRLEPGGVLSAGIEDLRLVVQAPDQAGSPVRFLVLRVAPGCSQGTLVGSGSSDDVQAAMAAAERMARDRAAPSACQPPSPS